MISDDQLNLVIGLIFSMPLSEILRALPPGLIRHIYSLVLGTALQIFVFGYDVWMAFLLHTLIYVILRVRAKKCGALITTLSLLILSVFHIYRMVMDYGGWKMDLSTILMTIVCKYSMLAYAVEDGVNENRKLSPEQESNKIESVPSFFHFLSYCLFLPTCIMGTAIEYKRFDAYMKKQGDYANIPPPLKQSAIDFGWVILSGGVLFVHITYIPDMYMRTQEFLEKGALYVLVYGWITVTLVRFKYYFAWKLSMMAVHFSGISYQKLPSGETNFKAVETCNIHMVQSTKHLRVKVSNWNMSCQEWLRKCIYERSTFKNKTYRQMLTFLVSAFWHGFYGGYYLSFMFWYVQIYLSQLIFSETKKQNSVYVKTYKKTGIVGRIILWIASSFLFTSTGVYFNVLSLKQSLEIMKAGYFIPPTVLILGIIFFTFMGTKRSKSEKTKKID